MMTGRGDLLPALLTLSPTALETWHRCPREWRNHRLLNLPASDHLHPTSHGLYLHDLLRHVHEHGSCHDPAHVAEVLAANGGDARAAEEIDRHAARCPQDAEAIAHEREWVRVNATPPVFLATARLDAVWLRDGVLEVRDYKTGSRVIDTLRDDPRARLQAWVAAPRAVEHGARLRIRYEYLAAEVADDPESWEPDDDELAAIDLELRDTVATMRANAASRDWAGVADPEVCGRCRYRSICPDSAAPSEPSWAALELSS
jgi:RecB family exonuclease